VGESLGDRKEGTVDSDEIQTVNQMWNRRLQDDPEGLRRDVLALLSSADVFWNACIEHLSSGCYPDCECTACRYGKLRQRFGLREE